VVDEEAEVHFETFFASGEMIKESGAAEKKLGRLNWWSQS
jgi:hypothetical protein